LNSVRDDVEGVLARPDLDRLTIERIRGELSASIPLQGMSNVEIENFVRSLRTASPEDAIRIIADFRASRVDVSIGGVSRNQGFDLSYLHTSQREFSNSVKEALGGEGKLVHGAVLRRIDDGSNTSYSMRVRTSEGKVVDANVVIYYNQTPTTSGLGAGSTTPQATTGPARNVVSWDADSNAWTIRVEVDRRLHPRDIGRAVGHELDEAGDIVHRLDGNQGSNVQEQIGGLQQSGIFDSGTLTSHDIATFRELEGLLGANPATNSRAGGNLSGLLNEMGLTQDRGKFAERLRRMMNSGQISPERQLLLEAWGSYDMAVARGSRIGSMSRQDFLDMYESGWRFSEGGSYRWYRSGSERGTPRQDFTDAEVANPNLAFNRLAGEDSTSSFRQYYQMLQDHGIVNGVEAKVKRKLRSLLRSSNGSNLDFVRHELKIFFRNDVIDHVRNRARLARTRPGLDFNDASHMEMLAVTKDLNSSDKGVIAELWYQATFSPAAYAHTRIRGSSGRNRFPDLIEPNGTLRDIKHIRGSLSRRELEQFDDYMAMKGSTVEVRAPDGTLSNIEIQRIEYTIANPEGAVSNAVWMKTKLEAHPAGLTFEIFNNSGQRFIVSRAGVFSMDNTKIGDLNFLVSPRFENWL
jgi:hypothetical protein